MRASRFGEAATHLAAAGQYGRMVALRGEEIVDVTLEQAVSGFNRVHPDGQLIRMARSIGIYLGDELVLAGYS